MTQKKRLIVAILLVTTCIALPAASTVFVNTPHEMAKASSAYVLKNYSSSEENFAVGLYERLAGKTLPGTLPGDFEAEFFDPAALGEYEAYVAEGVAGLYWEEGANASKESLVELLTSVGWQHIGATEESTSYIKENGVYRWLNMVVIERDGALSAVLNYREDV